MIVLSNSRQLFTPVLALILLAGSPSLADTITVDDNGGWEVVFQSGFEESNLFPSDGSGWSAKRGDVTQTTEKARTGSKSLRTFAPGGNAAATEKADISKNNFDLKAGETIRVSAWYWIPSDPDYIKTVTLMDIECSHKGNNSCYISKGPRIWTAHRRDPKNPPYISFGRGKINLPNLRGKKLHIPRDRWFKLTVEMVLAERNNGHVRLWIDDRLDIDAAGTMITPSNGLDHYNYLQFGISANSTGEEPNGQFTDLTIYVDDVLVERLRS